MSYGEDISNLQVGDEADQDPEDDLSQKSTRRRAEHACGENTLINKHLARLALLSTDIRSIGVIQVTFHFCEQERLVICLLSAVMRAINNFFISAIPFIAWDATHPMGCHIGRPIGWPIG